MPKIGHLAHGVLLGELAGEGIEYSWGCAKNSYCRVSLKQKRGKDNFKAVVRECLLREKGGVLVTEQIRLFSRRARAYICAYYMIWCEQQGRESARTNESALTTDPIKTENITMHPAILPQMSNVTLLASGWPVVHGGVHSHRFIHCRRTLEHHVHF
jgi:hypothetical protein